MKSRIPHNLLLLALLSSGCATTSAWNSQAAADLEQQAMAYQDEGDFESAIASYRSLAAMSAHHVRNVSYQQKILYATEPLSDGWRSVDEMRNTVQAFITARDEPYDGATTEWIQKTQDEIENYLLDKGELYFEIYHETDNSAYLQLSNDIYELYSASFPETENQCRLFYGQARTMLAEYLNNSTRVPSEFTPPESLTIVQEKLEWVLSQCNGDQKLDRYKYLWASHNVMYAQWRTSLYRSCPARYNLRRDEDGHVPIPECRQRYIRNTIRLSEHYQEFCSDIPRGGVESMDSLAHTCKEIYEKASVALSNAGHEIEEFRGFDEAISTYYKDVVQKYPLSDGAADTVAYCLKRIHDSEYHKKDGFAFIQEVKANREFMEGNTSKKMEDIRKTLIRLENALNETRAQWDK